jgi:hypothetical protein
MRIGGDKENGKLGENKGFIRVSLFLISISPFSAPV